FASICNNFCGNRANVSIREPSYEALRIHDSALSEKVKMKIFSTVSAVFVSIVAIAYSSSNQGPNRTWIADVTIISPERLDHIEKGSVLIENDRIVNVERNPAAKKPAGANVVSGKGMFLIPGLIDSHVHLASVPGDPAQGQSEMIRKYFK